MTTNEINQLRKSGHLNDALREVEVLRANSPKDLWVARTAAWVYLDLMSRESERADICQTISYIHMLNQLQLPPNEYIIFHKLIWNIATLLRNMSEKPINMTALLEMLDLLSVMPLNRQDESYYALLSAALKIKDTTATMYFIKWWDLNNLRPEDFKPRLYNNEKQMPLAEKAYYAQCKSIIATQNSNVISHYLPILTERATKYKQYQYLPYYQAQMLLFVGDNYRAKEVLKPFARQNDNSFWVWQLLGDMQNTTADKMPFYCRTILCKSPNQMLVKAWTNIGLFFFENERPALGKYLIENAIRTYSENGWKIPYQLQQIANSTIYQETRAFFDKPFLQEQALIAEEYLYGEMKTYTVMVLHYNAEKHLVSCLTESMQRIFFFLSHKNKDCYREGMLLSITTNAQKIEDKIKVHAITILQNNDNPHFYQTFEGRIYISPSGFGKVKDIFVPPELAAGLSNKAQVSGIAIRSYDRKKECYGWRAIAIS